jgi:hypothetical protein
VFRTAGLIVRANIARGLALDRSIRAALYWPLAFRRQALLHSVSG